ncbi:MAG: glucose-6-phosphate isomerase [Bacteroidales bacterium]
MKHISLNIEKIFDFVSKEQIEALSGNAIEACKTLEAKTGKGNDFLGWINLPSSITGEELAEIQKTADSLKTNDVVVVVGIGGSYLGAKAVIDALSSSFPQLQNTGKNPLVVFAGQNICEDYMADLLSILDQKNYAIVVISKSGTTTEPAIAFRILKQHIEAKYGKVEAQKRIVAVTDKARGALKQLSNTEGYKTFVIPDDVGGRFSVLTPVGLLPIAIAGFDIAELVRGAVEMENRTKSTVAYQDNIALQYAAARNALLAKGKLIEILVNYTPKLHNVAEWWKQLYGESEGKENKGIYPSSVDFTSDLHSMGQYIQEGARILFETILSVGEPSKTITIPVDSQDLDGLNFLSNKRIYEVNRMAELGTLLAHVDGGVPNIQISIPKLNEYYIGELLYFFEKACGVSGYLLGVNPFDQPGVEAYKKNMFALLGKPGFEAQGNELKKRLGL